MDQRSWREAKKNYSKFVFFLISNTLDTYFLEEFNAVVNLSSYPVYSDMDKAKFFA